MERMNADGIERDCPAADPQEREFAEKLFGAGHGGPGKTAWIDRYSQNARILLVAAVLFMVVFFGLLSIIDFAYSLEVYSKWDSPLFGGIIVFLIIPGLLGYLMAGLLKITKPRLTLILTFFAAFGGYWAALYFDALFILPTIQQESGMMHAPAALFMWQAMPANASASYWMKALSIWPADMQYLILTIIYNAGLALSIMVKTTYPFSQKSRRWLRIFITMSGVIFEDCHAVRKNIDFEKIMELPAIVPATDKNALFLLIDHIPEGSHYIDLSFVPDIKLFGFKMKGVWPEKINIPLTYAQLMRLLKKFGLRCQLGRWWYT